MKHLPTTLALAAITWTFAGCVELGGSWTDAKDGCDCDLYPVTLYLHEDDGANPEGGDFTAVIFDPDNQGYDLLELFVDGEAIEHQTYAFQNTESHESGLCVSPLRSIQLPPGQRLLSGELLLAGELVATDAILVDVTD
uniref:Lipoprotein n=1 Tax=viral metagenome TaxID=1070528 RepID=A0A6M3M851_9ZZZZ